MCSIQIKDLYAGKPDAKDEIEIGNIKKFVDSFILPPNWEINRMLSSSCFFVTGYKGTGKTALLRYIEDAIKRKYPYSCCSFILFKEDFPEIKRRELSENSQRMFNSVSIDKELKAEGGDFQFIWRFFFLSKFLNDNEMSNGGLFIKDENLTLFKKKMSEIASLNEVKLKWFSTFKFSLFFPSTSIPATFGISSETVLQENEKKYHKIIELIEEADAIFSKLIRTKTPYYIFVDELEAYFADEQIFIRDLHLIRDLLFNIHKYNKIFQQQQSHTKIIGAVRQEIINAISQKIDPRELNKIITGFSQPLNWEYNNTNSFQHPIIQILLRRIMTTRNDKGLSCKTDREIYEEWFPNKIHDKEPAMYILTNCWNKPRDIVRMLISAQNSIQKNASCFSQSVFDSFRKAYSTESLNEIKEELAALYSNQEIEDIVSCFNGFKISFSFKEFQDRTRMLCPHSPRLQDLLSVLRNLFRIGVIGNISTMSHEHRWYHRGDIDLQITDDWNIYVHNALHAALSLTSKRDYQRSLKPSNGAIVKVKVVKIFHSRVLVSIDHQGHIYKGCVPITEISNSMVRKGFLDEVLSEGEIMQGCILRYNSQYNSYDVSLKI